MRKLGFRVISLRKMKGRQKDVLSIPPLVELEESLVFVLEARKSFYTQMLRIGVKFTTT